MKTEKTHGVKETPVLSPREVELLREIRVNFGSLDHFGADWRNEAKNLLLRIEQRADGVPEVEPGGPMDPIPGYSVLLPANEAGVAEVQASSCEWREEDPWGPMAGTYESACGEAWAFTEGGPAENNVRFCQGCGKPVNVIPFPQPVDEADEDGVKGGYDETPSTYFPQDQQRLK